jgi:hypothetical protein
VTKEFEYIAREDGPGDLTSTPVSLKWKSKKKGLTNGLLDAAVGLYEAEKAMRLEKKGGQTVDMVEREGLWQFEKLREKLEKADEEDGGEPSFVNFFGFRGAVARKEATAKAGDGDEEEDEIEEDGFLDVEVFPAGEEVAVALAEDLWPNVMDFFMRADEEAEQDDVNGLDGNEDDLDSEDAPSLVGEEETAELTNLRPAKRQRTD